MQPARRQESPQQYFGRVEFVRKNLPTRRKILITLRASLSAKLSLKESFELVAKLLPAAFNIRDWSFASKNFLYPDPTHLRRSFTVVQRTAHSSRRPALVAFVEAC